MVVDNPVRAWPRAIYRDRLYRSAVLGHDSIYVMGPDLIRTVLLDDAESFEKGEKAHPSSVASPACWVRDRRGARNDADHL